MRPIKNCKVILVLALIAAIAMLCFLLFKGSKPSSSPAYSSDEISSLNTARININTASKSELSLLPYIGEQKSNAIIAYREENGPFRTADELLNVRGISEGSFIFIEPFITVG